MKSSKLRILKATARERRLIEALTSQSVFDRLDAGDLEIVSSDDWSGVPELEGAPFLRLPPRLYRKLQAASRKRRTHPDRLAAKWLAERLRSL